MAQLPDVLGLRVANEQPREAAQTLGARAQARLHL